MLKNLINTVLLFFDICPAFETFGTIVLSTRHSINSSGVLDAKQMLKTPQDHSFPNADAEGEVFVWRLLRNRGQRG